MTPFGLASISYPPIPIFEFGPFNLSLHGFMAALGFLAGAWVVGRMCRREGIDQNLYYSVITWSLIGALIGTRYGTLPAALFEGYGWEAFNPLQGNFSIMGGFLGGILAGGYRVRKLHLPLRPMLDLATIGLALGTVIGRMGDIFIVEHLGKATEVPWGYGVKPGYDLAPQHDTLECTAVQAGADGLCGIYHHAAAYDLLGALGLLVVLYGLRRWRRFQIGQLFSIWVFWYGLQRFLIDFLRFGSGDTTIGSFTWNQVVGLVGSLFGILLFWLWRSEPELIESILPELEEPPDWDEDAPELDDIPLEWSDAGKEIEGVGSEEPENPLESGD